MYGGVLKKLTLFILIFLAVAALASAQSRVEIIQLKHRLASELIPILQPLLGDQGSLTGMGYKLIVKTTPQNMRTVKQVLSKLDTAPRSLRIIVKQGLRSYFYAREAEISGQVRLSDKGVIGVNPGGSGGPGLSGTLAGKDGHVSGRLHEDRFSEDTMRTQQVVTLEGRPASIQIGQRIPFETFSPNEGKTVEFKDVVTGFSVLPRVNGNNVVLDIHPQVSSMGAGIINFQEVHTTVSGKLGEWIEVGALAEDSSTYGSRILANTQVRSNDKRSVFMKVVEEKPLE